MPDGDVEDEDGFSNFFLPQGEWGNRNIIVRWIIEEGSPDHGGCHMAVAVRLRFAHVVDVVSGGFFSVSFLSKTEDFQKVLSVSSSIRDREQVVVLSESQSRRSPAGKNISSNLVLKNSRRVYDQISGRTRF